MRQSTLFNYESAAHPPLPSAHGLEVYDLFCGGGGFSCGAELAGCRVVFACDSNEDALKTHAANHPGATHRLQRMPCDDLPFPTDGRTFHVHGSPPCQQFSSMQKCNSPREAADLATAEALVEWFLDTALRSGASSWSMEQVASERVLQIVERVRRAHPSRVAYTVCNTFELGVPQARRRLLTGPPALIARLERRCGAHRHRGVRAALTHVHGTHLCRALTWRYRAKIFGSEPVVRTVRNRDPNVLGYVRATEFDGVFPVDGVAPTVTTNGQLYWASPQTSAARLQLGVDELAALQTFPHDYVFPSGVKLARLLIGNAVPPLLATVLLQDRDGDTGLPTPPLPACDCPDSPSLQLL